MFLRITLGSFTLGLIFLSSLSLRATPGNQEPDNAKDRTSVDESVDRKGSIFVQTACTACHSAMVIESARKDEKGWVKTLAKMEQQGMQPLPPAIKASILQFLTEEHGPDTKRKQPAYLPWAGQADANPIWP